MKPIIYLMSALMLIATAEAKKKGNNKKNNERAKQEQKEKEEKRAAREKERDAIQEFLDGKDSNDDNSLTLEEFLTGESNIESATRDFNDANKNGDRYLSRGEIGKMLGF